MGEERTRGPEMKSFSWETSLAWSRVSGRLLGHGPAGIECLILCSVEQLLKWPSGGPLSEGPEAARRCSVLASDSPVLLKQAFSPPHQPFFLLAAHSGPTHGAAFEMTSKILGIFPQLCRALKPAADRDGEGKSQSGPWNLPASPPWRLVPWDDWFLEPTFHVWTRPPRPDVITPFSRFLRGTFQTLTQIPKPHVEMNSRVVGIEDSKKGRESQCSI